MMWYRTFRPLDLNNRCARIRRNLLSRVQDPVRSSNKRLGEICGICDDAYQGQVISVPNPVLRQDRAVTARDTIPPHPARRQRRRRYRKGIAIPLDGGKSWPTVGGIICSMWAVVHTDGRLRSLPGDMRVICDRLL